MFNCETITLKLAGSIANCESFTACAEFRLPRIQREERAVPTVGFDLPDQIRQYELRVI